MPAEKDVAETLTLLLGSLAPDLSGVGFGAYLTYFDDDGRMLFTPVDLFALAPDEED